MKSKRIIKVILVIIASLIGLLLLAVIAIYIWPLQDKKLQAPAQSSEYSYEEAVSAAQQLASADQADTALKPECHTIFMQQPNKTDKVVVMMHGYTECPGQFSAFAQQMYESGYTVLVPRAPEHGYKDGRRVVPAADALVNFSNETASIAKGLSPSSGVIGLSGGGVLATWMAHYRPDAIHRALVLSPFYEPHPSQAPKWQLKPLITLFGLTTLLGDVNNGDYGTYQGLTHYLLIAKNYPSQAAQIDSMALVLSEKDTSIDPTVAREQVRSAKADAKVYVTPDNWKAEHDIVAATKLGEFSASAYKDYMAVYEGRAPEYLEAE